MDSRIASISLQSAALGVADLVLPRSCVVCGRTLLLRERHICTECAADLPRTFFAGMRDNPMARAFNALIQKEIESEKAGSQAPSGLRSLRAPHKSPICGGPAFRSLRPLPASSAPSLRDSLLPPGPSPCPCPGVDTPSGVCYQPFGYAAALLYYREGSPYGKIPQGLKYGRNFGEGRYFARMLGQELAASELFADVDAVIPVPLHWARRWNRGYNQAEVVAREVAAQLGGVQVAPKALKRSKRTGTQTRLHGSERYANVKSAFKANVKALTSIGITTERPTHLLLIDDVFTTGSTLCACERALRKGLTEAFGPDAASRVRISVATLSYVGK